MFGSGFMKTTGGIAAAENGGFRVDKGSAITGQARRIGGVRKRGETKEEFRARMDGKSGDSGETKSETYLRRIADTTDAAWK